MFELKDSSRKWYTARGALISCVMATFFWWVHLTGQIPCITEAIVVS